MKLAMNFLGTVLLLLSLVRCSGGALGDYMTTPASDIDQLNDAVAGHLLLLAALVLFVGAALIGAIEDAVRALIRSVE